jgi:hypothetical protein
MFKTLQQNIKNHISYRRPIIFSRVDRQYDESKAIPEFHVVEIPGFQGNRHMKVIRMSALRTGRL